MTLHESVGHPCALSNQCTDWCNFVGHVSGFHTKKPLGREVIERLVDGLLGVVVEMEKNQIIREKCKFSNL